MVQLLDNPKRNQAPALNIGIGKAKGRVPRILDYLAKATVAVDPMAGASGIQNKGLNAMARRTPVVKSHAGPIPEIAGDAALFVGPLCPEAIDHALGKVLTEPNCSSHLRQARLERMQRFCRRQIVQAVLDIYTEAGSR